MSSNYYSQTPNFVSASSEDVDPRTRLFSFQHSLGQLIGNNAMGPEFTFSISYSATTNVDYFDLGIGIQLALTIYDASSGQLSLASGESYKVNTSTNPPFVEQNKMRTFDFIQSTVADGSTGYRVTEHDGSVTDLSEYDEGLFVPIKMYTPLGYSLNFDWVFTSRGWVLGSISDDSNVTLLKFDHDYGTLTFYPGSTEEYTLTLTKANGYLTNISHSGLPEGDWQYNYTDIGMGNGLLTLYETKSITGLLKTVTYNNGLTDGLMLFPTESGQGALPAVTELVISPGFGQPDMVTTYTPDSTQGFPNYLGYDAPQGGSWDPSTDYSLTLIGQDYFYSTILTQTDSDGQEIVTTYTYNNFHLLSKMEVVQGDTYYAAETYYYADAWQEDNPNTTFDELPAQYQYPLTQTLTWRDSSGSRNELTQYQYDDFGNLTQQIDPDGMQTDYAFYSADGEADSADGYTGCPADANGFANLMKSKTVTPAPSDYDDVPTRVTYYRYDSLAALADRPMTTSIVKVKESMVKLAGDDKQPLTTLDTQYYSDSASKSSYGLIHIKNTKVYSVDSSTKGSNSITEYVTTQAHTYTVEDNILQSDMEITTFDNYQLFSSMRRSCLSGHLIALTDFLNTPHNYYYDPAGRFCRMVKNEGDSDYEMTTRIEYMMSVDSNDPVLSTTITDHDDNITRISHDAIGRVISIDKSASEQINEDFSTVLTRSYDTLGRFLFESISDSYIDSSGSVQVAVVNIKNQFDEWGKSCAKSFFSDIDDPKNSIYQTRVMQYLHVENAIDRYVLAKNGDISSHSKAVLNESSAPDSVIHLDAKGNEYSRTLYYYDGLKRVRESVDQMDNHVIFGYDDFDRVNKTTYADGTVVTKKYAPQFSLDIVQCITVTDKDGTLYKVGERSIDGLGRVQNTTIGGRYEVYTYINNALEPNTFTDSLKRVFKYTYEPKLSNALKNVTASYGDLTSEQQYTYFKNRGLLDTVTEVGQQVNSYTWFASGKIDTETVSNDIGDKTPSYTWSVLSKPVSYTDIAGNIQWLNYYLSGKEVAKPQQISDPVVTVSFTYDDFVRLYQQKAESVNGKATLETKIFYDDFNRENIRKITPDNGKVITITTGYYENNQVASVTIEQDAEMLSDNQYKYDSRNRLQLHTCSGSVLPKDGYGQAFISQEFKYDSLNNIKTCITVNNENMTDTATFIYINSDGSTANPYINSSDPTQLTTINHSGNPAYPPVINLAYYDDGRLKCDEAGRTLTYDASGRLFNIETADGTQAGYGYDALNNLVYQLVNSEEQYLYYRGSQLVNQVRQSEQQQDRIITGLAGNAAVSHEQL